MTKDFTPENLLAYLYGELPAGRRLDTEDAIAADPVLAQEYRELRAAQQQLPAVRFNAPRRALNQVLSYSRRPQEQPC